MASYIIQCFLFNAPIDLDLVFRVTFLFLVNAFHISYYSSSCSRLDETCSHVIAILFKAQEAVMRGLHETSVTSSACAWNNKFKKHVEAEKMSSIQLTISGKQAKRRS